MSFDSQETKAFDPLSVESISAPPDENDSLTSDNNKFHSNIHVKAEKTVAPLSNSHMKTAECDEIHVGVTIYHDGIMLQDKFRSQVDFSIKEEMGLKEDEEDPEILLASDSEKEESSNLHQEVQNTYDATAENVVRIHGSIRTLPPGDNRLDVGDGIFDQIGFCDQLGELGKMAIPGIFTIRGIPSNTFIGRYEGTELDFHEALQCMQQGPPPYYLADLVPGKTWVCAKNYGNALRFINHHCTRANCILRSFLNNDGRLCLGVWTCDEKVKAGDHLYIHYGAITKEDECNTDIVYTYCQCMGFNASGAATCKYHFGF